MLCEKCKKNEAKINLVKIVNGEKQEIWLCEECAKNISEIPFLSTLGKEIEFPFQGFLTGVISNISNSSGESVQKRENLKCPNCGTTEQEFKKTGKVGCSMCYNVFSSEIEKVLKNKSTEHIGKIPKKSKTEIIQKRKLKNLKDNLQQLILNEQYEEAAIVRDSIKLLEDGILEENLVKNVLIEGEDFDGELDS